MSGLVKDDVYMTRSHLLKWIEATDMPAQVAVESTTKTHVQSHDFFTSIYSELVAQVDPLRTMLLQRQRESQGEYSELTTTELYTFLKPTAHGELKSRARVVTPVGALTVDWDILEKAYRFYKKGIDHFGENLPTNWRKIGTLLELRNKAIEVHEKAPQVRQAHQDIVQMEMHLKDLKDWIEEQGFKHRRYNDVLVGMEFKKSFLDAQLVSSRLAKLRLSMI